MIAARLKAATLSNKEKPLARLGMGSPRFRHALRDANGMVYNVIFIDDAEG